MPIIHLVRHGATATGGQSYAGRADVPLTAHGHIQAAVLADRLRHRPITAILASPLKRAIDTARPLSCKLGISISVDPDLVEFDFGEFEGRPKAEIGLSLRKRHLSDPVPGGEALADLWVRTGRVARRLRHSHQSGEIVVVGHHWTNRLLLGQLAQMTLADAARSKTYRPATGSIFTTKTGPASADILDLDFCTAEGSRAPAMNQVG